jgi:transcriptional regulator with XRE-family HTH domain
MNKLGEYLKTARKNLGLTLRHVQEKTGISNSYISQIETGKRGIPHPRILKKLAKVYNLDLQEVFYKADLIEDFQETKEDEIDKKFEFIIRDPEFKHGARLTGQLTTEAKLFIIELYEKLKNQELLKIKKGKVTIINDGDFEIPGSY